MSFPICGQTPGPYKPSKKMFESSFEHFFYFWNTLAYILDFIKQISGSEGEGKPHVGKSRYFGEDIFFKH